METSISIDQSEKIVDLVRKSNISDNPKEFWGEAVILAREDKTSSMDNPIYPDVDVEEIISFGEKVQHLDSIEDKYVLLLEKTTSGKLWYDILLGDDNVKMFLPAEEAVKLKFLTSGSKWKQAADIGAGTGNTIRSIAPYCEHIYGVDFAHHALRSGKEIGLSDNASLVVGKANELPFADHSLDLIVTNGLIYYLSLTETKGFVDELSRVLMRGGKFMHSSLFKENGEIVPKQYHQTLESAKGALIGLLGSMANGGGHSESLSTVDFNKLILESLNFIPRFSQDGNAVLLEYTRK